MGNAARLPFCRYCARDQRGVIPNAGRSQRQSATTAVRTSVRAVLENPLTMAAWGLIVAASLLIGSLPFFFGLAVVFPLLGHSTWHLYRRVVGH